MLPSTLPDKGKTPSGRLALKTISVNTRTPAALVDKTNENAGTPSVFVDKTHANTDTPAVFVKITHGCVTLDHDDTVNGQEDKLEEVAASLDYCFDSDYQKSLGC